MLPVEANIFAAIVPAPFGFVGVRTEASLISELVYLPPRFSEKAATDALSELAWTQLDAYFSQVDYQFSLPLKKVGTAFQHKVWNAISSIPCGEVRTYGQIAKHIQSAPRAVGQACGANWFPLIIPCHRVTATGGLGGFAHSDDETGFHVGVKRYLLGFEKVAEYLPGNSKAKQDTLW
jgi:methylated-DNA-[protein]-cysteine S-methyltransferase